MKSFNEWLENRLDFSNHFSNNREAGIHNDQDSGWDRFEEFIDQGWTWADVAGPTYNNDGEPIGNPSEEEKKRIISQQIVNPNLQSLPITRRSIRLLKGEWMGWRSEHPDGLGHLPADSEDPRRYLPYNKEFIKAPRGDDYRPRH